MGHVIAYRPRLCHHSYIGRPDRHPLAKTSIHSQKTGVGCGDGATDSPVVDCPIWNDVWSCPRSLISQARLEALVGAILAMVFVY